MRLTRGQRLVENSKEAAARRAKRIPSAAYRAEQAAEVADLGLYESSGEDAVATLEAEGVAARDPVQQSLQLVELSPLRQASRFPTTRQFSSASVTEMPGLVAATQVSAERSRLAELIRRRLRVWLLILASLAVIACVLIVTYFGEYGSRQSPLLVEGMVAVGAASLVAATAAAGIIMSLASFLKSYHRMLDPAVLDLALSNSIQYGDTRGNGARGWYVTRSQLESQISTREQAFRRGVITIFLPPECGPSALQTFAAEAALRRWWDLGLLEVSPLLAGPEMRFIFVGKRLQSE